jgi:excisionase family DNA binding protein
MKTKEDYPMVLTVSHIQEILHIGRRQTYELMNKEGFPSLRIGKKSIRIPRDQFFEWLEKEGARK